MPAACAIVRSAHRSSLLEINEDISVLPQIAGVCEQTASGDILLGCCSSALAALPLPIFSHFQEYVLQHISAMVVWTQTAGTPPFLLYVVGMYSLQLKMALRFLLRLIH